MEVSLLVERLQEYGQVDVIRTNVDGMLNVDVVDEGDVLDFNAAVGEERHISIGSIEVGGRGSAWKQGW